MRLEGSCHCGAVRFAMETHTPYPYMRCYCSICRKTGGGGGYAINLMAAADSLDVQGEDALRVYQAVIDGAKSQAQRHFCGTCGSALWVFDPRWPDLIHPFASAIDSDLPKPPQTVHIMQIGSGKLGHAQYCQRRPGVRHLSRRVDRGVARASRSQGRLSNGNG